MTNDKEFLESQKKKSKIIERCREMLGQMCKGLPRSCHYKTCGFNGSCFLKEMNNEELLQGKMIRLEALLKNVNNRYNKMKGRQHYLYLGNGIHEIASTLLGVNVFKHPLVTGKEHLIKRCTTMRQIVQVLKYSKSGMKDNQISKRVFKNTLPKTKKHD